MEPAAIEDGKHHHNGRWKHQQLKMAASAAHNVSITAETGRSRQQTLKP
jgi:hypothetical protein